MDYVEYPETELVRSNELTGSMVVTHQRRLVRSHAVARNEDGTLRDMTECGLRVYSGPEAQLRRWEQTHPYKRCQVCVETAGGELRGPDGKRYFPPAV
jgi:hypothetical protein